MKKNFFIGIDISKYTIDAALVIENKSERPQWKVFDNTAKGMLDFALWLKELNVPFTADTIVVIENTGIYHRRIVNFCVDQNLPICVENGAQVKWSLGIARGKSDKVDSRRLAVYAMRFADRLKPAAGMNCELQYLKDLITLRSRHKVQLSSLKAYLKELRFTTDNRLLAQMEKLQEPLIKATTQLIKDIEKEMVSMIKNTEHTKKQYDLLLSIPCIGPITAAYLIACTNGFTNCNNAKQLACYCGVVPFTHQSGISIKGKHKVHKMANKTLKALLHLCALAAIKYIPEFQSYYQRKMEEGKHAMCILNAIRNKLVLRAFSVVKNERFYVDNLENASKNY